MPEKITVVGLGASAGGLKALKALLSSLPEDTGMSFVIIVHLSPEHKSALAELLQPSTGMTVKQVTEDTRLSANCVYVIPPGKNLRTIDSHLRITEPKDEQARRNPIDVFFRTLATTHGEKAVGVILTGTGSDGTLGLSQIKQHGGFCIAQDPDEAEFDGMPRSAVGMGMVDLVLPVEGISRQLAVIAGTKPSIPLPGDGESLPKEAEKVLHKIFERVRTCNGHDFSRYKQPTMLRRIRRRMILKHVQDLEDYYDQLKADDEEVSALFKDLLITVTSFFRDENVFEYLESDVVPGLFEGKSRDDAVRVWVVGCSTGEEAYSIAMLLLEYREKLNNPPALQVFASDLHENSLTRARAGFYPDAISLDVCEERLKRFFIQEKSGYRIRQEVRDCVVFSPHNLIKDPPFSHLDLITCRNVLIYLQKSIQREVFKLFHYALKPAGYLLMGTSESVENTKAFRVLNKEYSVYLKRNVRIEESQLPLSLSLPLRFAPSHGRAVAQKPQSPGVLHHRVVEQYGPPGVLVNQSYEIVHYSQHASRFLRQPGGEPTDNLFLRVREELRLELRSVLHACKDADHLISSMPVKLQGESDLHVVLRVRRINDGDAEGYFLVLFDELHTLPRAAVLAAGEEFGDKTTVSHLETELEQTKRRLQASIEDYESSQEEMRAANEEMLSANEELRSTMEELETSKEELQSMNEELTTANQENKHKVEELSQLANDLQNLLSATDIATLFLDRKLRILRFTPQISEIFNIQRSDMGRCVTDFSHTLLGYDGLVSDANHVFRSLQPVEREVQDAKGRWYLFRLLPYRTVEDRIEGVVLTIVEVTAIKKTRYALGKSEDELKSLTALLEHRVLERSRQVRKLASQLTLAEQSERDRIAKILHEDLQQVLCNVQMKLFLLAQQNELERKIVDELNPGLIEAIDMTRQLAVDISPPVLANEGLIEALEWLNAQMRKMYGLEVNVQSEGVFPFTSKGMRIMLFQFIRELLLNIVRHTNADKAVVRLSRKNNNVTIAVEESGGSFDFNLLNEPVSGDMGLKGMRERLSLFDGSLHIDSDLGSVTRVSIVLPIEIEQELLPEPGSSG